MARRGKHEGSIFRKANGSWMAQVSIDGRRVGHGGKSRQECQEWVRRMLDDIDRGMTFEVQNLTLGAYLAEWIEVKQSSLRAKTAFQYGRLISLYLEPGLGKIKVRDLSLRTVNQFYGRLLKRGVGVSNIRYSHRVLHAALEQALRGGIISRNPAHGATLPRRRQREMLTLNEGEVGVFLVAAGGSRYRSLYHLAIVTGMRISELRGLTWADVDWIQGTIKVRRQIQDIPGQGPVSGDPKTLSGSRTILLNETTLNELREQQRRVGAEWAHGIWKRNDLIFPSSKGTPFAKTDVQRDFWELLKVANLPRIRFHDLRHTAASIMLNHGVPALVVSRILGHANASVTLTVYAHSNIDMQSQAARVMDELVTPIAVSMPQLQPIATNCNPD